MDTADLGPIADLARALGLVTAEGAFAPGWLSDPGKHLARVLSDDGQREALVRFMDDALGGGAAGTDADGLMWLPVVDSGALTVCAVLDVQSDHVAIGVGVTVSGAAELRAHVPVFRTGRGQKTVPDPVLLGKEGCVVRVDLDIPVHASAPGELHLGGVAVTALVPTVGGKPTLSVRLRGLRLPGAAGPGDFALDDVADALPLLLGLVGAQADRHPGQPVEALARLIGLRPGVPPLPVQALLDEGAAALAEWFLAVTGNPASRAGWLGALGELVGGQVLDGALRTTVGAAQLSLGLAVTADPGGHPRVTPTFRVTAGALVAEVDLCVIAAGSVTALPRLSAYMSMPGQPVCGQVRVGFTLDADRRPVFLLATDDVDLGPHHFDTLDLTNPGALAGALDQVLDTLFATLGTAADRIRALIGLSPPDGVPPVSVTQLVQHPVQAVREHWRRLVTEHPQAVPEVLEALRGLVGEVDAPVTGAGTAEQPWVVPLKDGIALHVSAGPGGLEVALVAHRVVDTLGHGCTRVDTTLRFGLATLDLAGGHVVFRPSVEGRLITSGTDTGDARFPLGDHRVRADHIGLGVAWRPESGLAVEVLSPNLDVDGVPMPSLTAPGGPEAAERLIALLSESSGAPWLTHLVEALGWQFAGTTAEGGLPLADLLADPAGAIGAWLGSLRGDRLVYALHTVARLVGGTAERWGPLHGSGRPDDPYLVPLGPDQSATPQLALWLAPDGPSREATAAPPLLRGWRPGMDGLSGHILADALAAEARVASDLADLLAGRADVAAGLDALWNRWIGTDGRVVPPSVDPAGVSVHRLDAPLDLTGVLGHAPAAAVVHVVVTPDDRADVPPERRIDLGAPGLAPEAFPVPTGGPGEWLVLLGGRADCVQATDDPDGVGGQAGRLRRALEAFGPVTVVASAEAGHAALRALDGRSAAELVTLGTPWGPVAFTVVDDQPAADTLRLLHHLLPPPDPEEPDDDDLALGRRLVEGLHVMTTAGDPGRELRPPATGITLPAGVPVHAVYEVLGPAELSRALTAVVAAGLALRARERPVPEGPATGIRLGVRVPLPRTGLASGHATVEFDGTVHARLDLRRSGGWLVGGPEPGRAPGPRPGLEVRWLSADVTAPRAGAGEARLVLHEADVFGVERVRWQVDGTPDAPLLPEIRALMSGVAAELAADAASAPVVAVLTALGVLSPTGGVLADGLDHLLHDPAAHLSAARTSQLDTALTTLLATAGVDADVDVITRTLTLALGGDGGMLPWTFQAVLGPDHPVVTATVGAEGALVRLKTPALTVEAEWGERVVPLWPKPDATHLLELVLSAEVGRRGLAHLRDLDPVAAPLIDGVLGPLGLSGLGSLPGVLADPGRLSDVDSAAFFDGLKPVLGVGGAPGEWQLAAGVALRAGAQGLVLELDTGPLALTVSPGPTVALSLTTDPGALLVTLADQGLTAVLRPDAGADIPLHPDPPGLGVLVAGASPALPAVLDALSAPLDAVGAVVRAVGDLFALRVQGAFSGPELTAFASDPATALAKVLLNPPAGALTQFRDALDAVLPGTVVIAGGGLTVTAHDVTLSWQPNPFRITLSGDAVLSPVGGVSASVELRKDEPKATIHIGPSTVGGFRPYVRVVTGDVAEVGLVGDTRTVAARWSPGGGPTLMAIKGKTTSIAPDQVALALLDVLTDPLGDYLLGTDSVQQLLARGVGAGTVRGVLDGPVLAGNGLAPGLADPTTLRDRLVQVAVNLAAAGPEVTVHEHLTARLVADDGRPGIALALTDRVLLGGEDIAVWLEGDSHWIRRPDGSTPQPGLVLRLLKTGQQTTFGPVLELDGLGVRIGRHNAPLLGAGVRLGSVALHGYGRIGAGAGAGVQVTLTDLAVGLSGAGSGANKVAEGVLRDTGKGSTRLAPAFSPTLAVQRHGTGPILVSLSAGEGAGPWWLSIQKGFGPVYVEQVGFGVTIEQDKLERISLLLDGRVSLFGLTAAVDDLQLYYAVSPGGAVTDAGEWGVDLAGFAFAADLAGISLEGGLRRFGEGANVEYVGMLLGRFAAYGLSVYGGYGTGVADGQSYASFFAYGAVTGPIGGPPAFFLTGIGGGLGINRALAVPRDLGQFGDFVLIKALDPASQPSGDPMAQLQAVRSAFPMEQGQVWFAAGVGFTSFAVVDGIAVVSVSVGDGLEIALLGLARMALPRPEFALVSIELGLLARFSTAEGVLWVQAQLTENSWLLHESVRLTGGFAFVAWYKGQYAGQFVLTIGGYHPNFHRDGYPVVPRLGFRWAVGDFICVKGEAYFALTSEALMAGGRLEASAEFGPAWAHVVFGADGIVYYDPFRYELSVYARISAGITIDFWIGELTISISRGASLWLAGPKFHGRATFDIGPVEITVPFGDTDQNQKVHLDWDRFVAKYLEAAGGGRARAITAVTGRGTLAADRPFVVHSEFELLVATTVPVATFVAGAAEIEHGGALIGIAPMNVADAGTRLEIALLDGGLQNRIGELGLKTSQSPGFPIGVWGPPQPDDDRKVPRGDTISAIDGAVFTATAAVSGTLPTQVAHHQVEIGDRLPLPFLPEHAQRGVFLAGAAQLGQSVTAVPVGQEVATAVRWLADGGASRQAVAAFGLDRTSPPLLGSLGEGFLMGTGDPAEIEVATPPAQPAVDRAVHPPRAVGVLTGEHVVAPMTTVGDAPDVPRSTPPDLVSVRRRTGPAIPARLVRRTPPAAPHGKTAVAVNSVPVTRVARGAVAAVSGRFGAGKQRLTDLTTALTAPTTRPGRLLRPGEVAVLQLPNAAFDTDRKTPRPTLAVAGQARVIAFAHGGAVLESAPGVVPAGTERLVVVAGASTTGVAGWHSGQELAYIGWSTAVVAGAVVHAEGAVVRRSRDRYRTGWVPGAEFVDPAVVVTTRFDEPVTAVAVVVDDPLGTAAARGLALALSGARAPQPPTVVALGNRSALVYGLEPDATAVSVGVASQPGWHLVGVLGLVGTPAELADRLARHGVDAVVRPLADGAGSGVVEVEWRHE
ncbi:DUF6603 domain-containing protein [Saccharothrix stipae]